PDRFKDEKGKTFSYVQNIQKNIPQQPKQIKLVEQRPITIQQLQSSHRSVQNPNPVTGNVLGSVHGEFLKGVENVGQDYYNTFNPDHKSKSALNKGIDHLFQGDINKAGQVVYDAAVENPAKFAGEVAVEAATFIVPVGPALKLGKIGVQAVKNGIKVLSDPVIINSVPKAKLKVLETAVDAVNQGKAGAVDSVNVIIKDIKQTASNVGGTTKTALNNISKEVTLGVKNNPIAKGKRQEFADIVVDKPDNIKYQFHQNTRKGFNVNRVLKKSGAKAQAAELTKMGVPKGKLSNAIRDTYKLDKTLRDQRTLKREIRRLKDPTGVTATAQKILLPYSPQTPSLGVSGGRLFNNLPHAVKGLPQQFYYQTVKAVPDLVKTKGKKTIDKLASKTETVRHGQYVEGKGWVTSEMKVKRPRYGTSTNFKFKDSEPGLTASVKFGDSSSIYINKNTYLMKEPKDVAKAVVKQGLLESRKDRQKYKYTGYSKTGKLTGNRQKDAGKTVHTVQQQNEKYFTDTITKHEPLHNVFNKILDPKTASKANRGFDFLEYRVDQITGKPSKGLRNIGATTITGNKLPGTKDPLISNMRIANYVESTKAYKAKNPTKPMRGKTGKPKYKSSNANKNIPGGVKKSTPLTTKEQNNITIKALKEVANDKGSSKAQRLNALRVLEQMAKEGKTTRSSKSHKSKYKKKR
ncbi:MAG: hypothetical protein ACYS26_20665, partial [Planctomycetota bacterium]